MRVVRTVVCLALFATLFAARPAKAASARQAAGDGECRSVNASMGEAKFTGQISGSPTADAFQVTSGKQTAIVNYSGSVLVCEGGQPASTSTLVAGASVVVFGPTKREKNGFEMTATKIVVAGPPQGSQRGAAPGGDMTGADSFVRPTGEQKGQNAPGGIACSSIELTVNAPKDVATGRGIGRTSASGITCRKPIDQVAMELVQDAVTMRRLATITLTAQNELVATLTNAEVASVVFTAENGAQLVEVTFDCERAEIQHSPSGMRVTF